jgi:hypothetical protein
MGQGPRDLRDTCTVSRQSPLRSECGHQPQIPHRPNRGFHGTAVCIALSSPPRISGTNCWPSRGKGAKPPAENLWGEARCCARTGGIDHFCPAPEWEKGPIMQSPLENPWSFRHSSSAAAARPVQRGGPSRLFLEGGSSAHLPTWEPPENWKAPSSASKVDHVKGAQQTSMFLAMHPLSLQPTLLP